MNSITDFIFNNEKIKLELAADSTNADCTFSLSEISSLIKTITNSISENALELTKSYNIPDNSSESQPNTQQINTIMQNVADASKEVMSIFQKLCNSEDSSIAE